MSQHDMNVANQGFPAFRADMNNAFTALASNSAGTTEPSTTFAYQFWYDETNDLLKLRNSDNDAWITLAYFDQTTDEWEIRSAVIQAVDSAGVKIKADDGTVGLTVEDDGTVEIEGALAPIGGITNLLRIQQFTSSGTYTPSTDATKAVVHVVGGGGAGGGSEDSTGAGSSAGTGGNSGGIIVSDVIDVSGGSYTSTITIGSGGSGSNASAGGDGGDTTYADGSITLTAAGGAGGRLLSAAGTFQLNNAAALSNNSVSGHTPILNTGSKIGDHAFSFSDADVNNTAAGGNGGSCQPYGSGGRATARDIGGEFDGANGEGFGAGGGGAASVNNSDDASGGNGADGVVIIYEYL